MPGTASTGRTPLGHPLSHWLWGVGLFVVGTWAGLSVAWVADDAYISFRYARNLVEGVGLVYNPGEYVEGYTNPLWTLWMALGLSLGALPEPFAEWSGSLCFGALAAALGLAWLGDQRVRVGGGGQRQGPAAGWGPGLPLAALLLITAPDAREFATAGLEGAPFCLFAWAGLRCVTLAVPRPGWAGLWLALATLTRPDGVVFFAVAVLAGVILRPRPPGRALWALAWPWLLLVGSHEAFRIAYYGDVLPNTYYAKSAWLPYWSQGLRYAGFFYYRNWVLLLAVPVWVGLVIRDHRAGKPLDRNLIWLVAAIAYSLYVMRVGGDFMYARLLAPTLPLWAVALERGIGRAPAGTRARRAGLMGVQALLAGAIFVGPLPDQALMWKHDIALERAFPDPLRVDPRRGDILGGFFEGLHVGVAFVGGDARLMYRARVPLAVECETGLTDRFIARQPLAARGRVGHEKPAPVDYLLEQRTLHVTFRKRAMVRLGLLDAIPPVPVQFGPVDGFLLRWDPALVRQWRARGAGVPDFPAQLDRLIAALPRQDPAQVAELYPKLRRFYFAHVDDPKREQPFLDRLGRAR